MNSEQQSEIVNGAIAFVDERIKARGASLEDFIFICELITACAIAAGLKTVPESDLSSIETTLDNIRNHVVILINSEAN